MLSSEEDKHVYLPPNYQKLGGDVDVSVYSTIIDYMFMSIRESGIIIMDGLGKHTDKTVVLLKKAWDIENDGPCVFWLSGTCPFTLWTY